MSDSYDLDAGPNPADYAARAPEAPTSENPVYAVGIGPGNAEYLTTRGERAIEEADVIVGFETVVGFVAQDTNADLLTCGYRDEGETLARFAERIAAGESGVAVLMGDPNHSGYQFLGKVEQATHRPVRVIPGISSLQMAASRARTPLEETEFVTLHKSGGLTADLDRLRDAVGERHLLVLPRPFDLMPGDVAAELIDAGASSDLTTLVLERLTHEDEEITETGLGELAEHAGEETPYSDLSVLAVRHG